MPLPRLSPLVYNSLIHSRNSFQNVQPQFQCSFRKFSVAPQAGQKVESEDQDQYVYQGGLLRPRPLIQVLYFKLGQTLGIFPSPPRPCPITASILYQVLSEMREDPVGSKILKDRPVISAQQILEYENYPANSLGKILSSNLSLKGPIAPTPTSFASDTQYIFSRFAQSHHCLQALFKLPSSDVSDLALRWFEFVQTGLSTEDFTTVFGSVEIPYRLRNQKDKIVPWALSHARNHDGAVGYITSLRSFSLIPLNRNTFPESNPVFFLNIRWEDHMKEDVDQLIQKFGFARPDF